MTKDELLAKIQSTVDEQQAKLEELKSKAVDESEEAVEDVRAAIAKPKHWPQIVFACIPNP